MKFIQHIYEVLELFGVEHHVPACAFWDFLAQLSINQVLF